MASFNSVNDSVPNFLKPAFENYSNAWQLQTFADQQPSFNPATSLFVVWLFPNDIFYSDATSMLPGVVPGSPGGTDLISNGIANILTTIGTLAQAGAEHFLVPNMPNLGLTPAFAGTPQAGPLSFLTDTFNSNLAAQLTALDAMLAAEIVQFDTNGSFARIRADPLAYGFDNTTDSCVANLANGLCNPGNWDRWLFWDGVHPTTSHSPAAGKSVCHGRARAIIGGVADDRPACVVCDDGPSLDRGTQHYASGTRGNGYRALDLCFYTPRYRANFSGARASSADFPSSTTRPFSSTTQRSVCASTER